MFICSKQYRRRPFVQCMQLGAGIFAKSDKKAGVGQIYNVSNKSFYFWAENFSMLILASK